MTDDFYDLLDVPADASQDEIKGAFRENVRIYHPDLNDDDRAQAQFTALKRAYNILGDPVERRAYDRLGHEEYVAKRTKGIPSPDLWRTDSDDEEEGREAATASTAAASNEGSAGTTADGRSSAGVGSGGTTAGEEAGGTSIDGRNGGTAAGGATRTNGARTSGANAAGTDIGPGSGDAGSAGAASASGSASTSGGTGTPGGSTTGRRRTGSRTASSRPGRPTNNAVVRWWRRRSLAWPLIWAATLTYVAGLGQFALGNESNLRELAADLAAAGADPTGIWSVLTAGRHGIEAPLSFVTAAEPVTPPLARPRWYAALAGLVALSVIVVVGARIAWRRDTWGPISIDETVVVALALGSASVALGGSLLAGAALMPLLFGVVVRRTRQLPGWSPSRAYVVAVLAPVVGLGAGAAGYASIPGDLAAFVVVPLAGALGLPLRASVRKRFGR